MICLKCGNEIKDNEQICGKCGWNKINNVNETNAYATVNRGIYNPNAVDKNEANKVLEEQQQFDELLQIYIGDKYYNFKKGKFSFCAFFLGPIYFLYRKLYGVGIIVLIINYITQFIFLTQTNYNNILNNLNNTELLKLELTKSSSMNIIYPIVTLILMLLYGFIFKKFYFHECIERVAKIKKDNPNMGFNQLCELVRHKGGVNKVVGIIFGILIGLPILLMLILFIIILYTILLGSL